MDYFTCTVIKGAAIARDLKSLLEYIPNQQLVNLLNNNLTFNCPIFQVTCDFLMLFIDQLLTY